MSMALDPAVANSFRPRTVTIGYSNLLLLTDSESENATMLRCLARDMLGTVRSLNSVAVVPTDGVNPASLIGNICCALSEMQTKTALLEADLRTPQLARLFGIPAESSGLAEMLDHQPVGGAGWYEINPWLSLLPSGQTRGDVGKLLSSPTLHTIVAGVVAAHKLTIVSCPPATESHDVKFIAPCCDAVIVVARKNKTRMADVIALRQQVERLRLPLVYSLMTSVATEQKRSWPRHVGRGIGKLLRKRRPPLDY